MSGPCTIWWLRFWTTQWMRRVAGHANRIEVELHADYSVTIRDNGRGIPVDPPSEVSPTNPPLRLSCAPCTPVANFLAKPIKHPEACMGLVHSSGQCALPIPWLSKSPRNRGNFTSSASPAVIPLGPIAKIGAAPNRRGTSVTFPCR